MTTGRRIERGASAAAAALVLATAVLRPASASARPIGAQASLSFAEVSFSSAGVVNALVPPGAPPVLKDAALSKSAVGPGYTVIPLPAFTYNRNEGSWIGGLTPIFRANDRGEVEDIYAPLYLHNRLIGETFTFNYFGYRHLTEQFHFVASHATKIERTVDFSYSETALDGGRYLVSLQANSGKSAFNRFFGFGNNTTASQESVYAMSDSNLKLSGGINMTDSLALVATARYRGVRLENGATQSLPQTLDAYPDVPGIDGADVVGQSLALQYDTRDNQLTPLRGTLAKAFVEYDENVKFSERNRWWRVTGEARTFLPHADGRAVLVIHGLADGVLGQSENKSLEDTVEQDTGMVDAFGNPILQSIVTKRLIRRGVPFYERPSLGGETTLRGFGRGRYISNFAYLVNLEERVSLTRRKVMGNVIELELAPFVDVGRVGRFDSQNPLRDAQIDPGLGVRLLARPNIAGRLDVGKGKDGTSVYVGLDYPF